MPRAARPTRRFCRPPLAVIPTGGPGLRCHPRAGGGPGNQMTRNPQSSSSRPEGRRPGVEGSVRTALPQGTGRQATTASAVSPRDADERVPRSAALRSASHRVTRNDGEDRGLHRVTRNDDDGAACNPTAVIPTGGRVACPRSRGHVLAMQGGVRRPMATLCVAMPPNGFAGPPLAVIPTGGPKARSGGTRSNSPSTRHRTPSRSMLSNGE